jgi:glycopeptide antibiotics resistance protein
MQIYQWDIFLDGANQHWKANKKQYIYIYVYIKIHVNLYIYICVCVYMCENIVQQSMNFFWVPNQHRMNNPKQTFSDINNSQNSMY